MAKNINHLQHVKSNVVESGLPKLPSPSVLVEGEIAVNYAADHETISLKNSSGVVVAFSSDNYYSEKKLGSGFTGTNSAVTVTEIIEENELITATALADLNNRKMDLSAYTPTDLSNYYNKAQVDAKVDGVSGVVSSHTTNTQIHTSAVTMNGATLTTSGGKIALGKVVSAATLNGTAVSVTNAGVLTLTGVALSSDLTGYVDGTEYNSNDKKIYFKHGNTTLSSLTIDATDFIKDGMVESAWTEDVSGTTYLKIKWNNDGGDATTDIDIGDLFEADNYYDKDDIDEILGSGFTGENTGLTITKAIEDNEIVIAAALSDLDSRKMDASAYTPTDLSNYYNKQQVDQKVSGVSGVVSSHISDTSIHVTTAQTAAWDGAVASSHTHTNKTILDNISSTDITNWNNKVSAITINNGNKTTPTNGVVNVTVPTKLSDITSAHTHPISEVTNLQTTLNAKVSAVTINGGTKTPTNGVVALGKLVSSATVNGSAQTVTDAGVLQITGVASNTDFTAHTENKSIHTSAVTINGVDKATSNGKVNLGNFYSAATINGGTMTATTNGTLALGKLVSSATVNGTAQTVTDAGVLQISGVTANADFTAHTANTTAHITAAERTSWDSRLSGVTLNGSAVTVTNNVAAITGVAMQSYVDERLGSGFTGENSGRTVTGVIQKVELVTSAALNDLNANKMDITAYTPTDLSDYYTKTEVDGKLDTKVSAITINNGSQITPTNGVVNVTVPTALSQITSAHTHAISDVTNLQTTLNAKVSAVTINGGTKTPTNGVVALGKVVSAATVNGTSATVTDAGVLQLTGITTNNDFTAHTTNGQIHTSAVTMNGATISASGGKIALGTVVSAMSLNGTNQTVTNGKVSLSGIAMSTDLNPYPDNATYNSTDKKIYFKHGNTTLANMTIDASDFIVDGMVSSVTLVELSGDTYLRVTWNTDAGSTVTDLNIGDIFDADNYYNKTQIDDKLGSGFTGENSGLTITQVIEEDEFAIATALNDLEERKLDASAYTETDLSNYYNKTQIDDKLGSGFTGENSGMTVTRVIEEDEYVMANALNYLNTTKLDASAYTPIDMALYYNKGEVDLKVNGVSGAVATHIADTTAHVTAAEKSAWDSKLSGVSVNGSAVTVSNGVASISGVATEDFVYSKLGSGFTGANSAKTVTDAINETEKVAAAALNDLYENKLDASAYTAAISDFYTKEDIEDKEEVIAAALVDLDDRFDVVDRQISQIDAKADSVTRSLSQYTPMGYSFSKAETNTMIADLSAVVDRKADASTVTASINNIETTLGTAIENREKKMEIVSGEKTSDFTAEVGKYYKVRVENNATLAVTLPTTGFSTTYVQSIVFYVTLGTGTSKIQFSNWAAKTEGFDYMDADSTYEINAMWNGSGWIMAMSKLITA